MSSCDVCGKRRADVLQPHTGLRLCRGCFTADLVARVSREIFRFGMIRGGEKILLAISGGKDSFTLLDVMSRIYDPELLGGVTIVEGIASYNRAEHVEEIKRLGAERGVEIFVYSLKELWGASVDEMVEGSKARGLRISPCTYCGIHRRKGMNIVARELGYDKVATAHNLDDEVQTLMINVLRGDLERLLANHPRRAKGSRLFVDRIKPLRKIYERETAAYAYLAGFRPQEVECPYLELQPSLRARIREILYEVERERPGTLLKVLEWYDNAFDPLREPKKPPELPSCEACGEPTSPGRTLCKSCELQLHTMGKIIGPVPRAALTSRALLPKNPK